MSNSSREGFVFYKAWHEAISRLPMEQQAEAYSAIMMYALYGTEPEDEFSMAAIILQMAKPTIEKNDERYQNGKKGGRPRTKESSPAASAPETSADSDSSKNKKTIGFENKNHRFPNQKPTETVTDTETVTVTDTETVTDTATETDKTQKENENNDTLLINRQQTLAGVFDELWDLYPRKQGKKSAFESFKRAVRDGTHPDQIRAGILAYKRWIREERTDPQYIKQGSTFFSQRAWQDDWTPQRPRDGNRPLSHEEMMEAAARIDAGGTAHDWGGT